MNLYILNLLSRCEGHMMELAAYLSVTTPQEIVERHNAFTREIGDVLRRERSIDSSTEPKV
jgi:hypothetical protein